MMISGYAKTDLAEQERMIAEWKKERGFVETAVINNDPLKNETSNKRIVIYLSKLIKKNNNKLNVAKPKQIVIVNIVMSVKKMLI